jgi:hypothetical protein
MAGLGVLLLASVAALYGQFLWNPIVFDDLPFFMADQLGNQPVSAYHFAWTELRSLPYATLAWTKSAFGLELIYFRLGGLLLHVSVVLTLFFLLRNLFTAVLTERQADTLSPQGAAFFAALLFGLHPVATYAAGYLVQRTIVMATLFSLLALWAYLYGSHVKKPVYLWLTVPLYYLAVFSKEHAIMLIFVLIAMTVLLHTDWLATLKERAVLFAIYFAISALVLVARRGIFGTVYEINAPEMLLQTDASLSYPLSVLTQTWLFFKYSVLWLLPNPAWMSVDMREPFAQSMGSVYLLSALGFIAWGAGALYLLFQRGRLGLLGFGMLFPWLMFFTEFSSVRIQEVFVLYRSYLWAAGAMCVLPVILGQLQARLAGMVLGVLAIAAFAVSMERLVTFSHPLLLWSDAVKLVAGRSDLQGAARIYYNRGTEFNKNDFLDQAIEDLKQATVLEPYFAEAHGNLGSVYLKKSEWSNAAQSFSTALEVEKRKGVEPRPRYFLGRAQSLEKMGDMPRALADYQMSCRLIQRGCEKLLKN